MSVMSNAYINMNGQEAFLIQTSRLEFSRFHVVLWLQKCYDMLDVTWVIYPIIDWNIKYIRITILKLAFLKFCKYNKNEYNV